MGHLLSCIDTAPPRQLPERTKPPSSPTKSITASTKSALLVENDESLSNLLRRCLKDEGYAVRIASNSQEGLRLYRDCAPFTVVLIDYCVPQRNGIGIDYCAPQTQGIELAKAIRDIDPSQGIIIAAFDFRSVGEVPRPPEVMHIPLLVHINILDLRMALEKIELHRAVKALTTPEQLRLKQFAKFRVRGLGRAAGGRDWEDLLEDAIYRTFIGAADTSDGRHWNKKVDLVRHLTQAMRSISSCWKRQFKEENTYLVSELRVRDAEGQEYSPIDNVASGDAAADEHLIGKEEEDRVFAVVKHDADATQVLEGLVDGLKKNEIMSRYGLDEKKYAAAVRRIRVRVLGGRNNGDRGKDNGI